MQQKEFYLEVVFPAKLWQTFTYKPLDNIKANYFRGQRILVPLRTQYKIGFVHHLHYNKPEYRVRAINEIIDVKPIIPVELYEFLDKLSTYYLAPLGQVLDSALPSEIKMQKFRTFFCNPDKTLETMKSQLYNLILSKPGINYISLKKQFDKKKLNVELNKLKMDSYILEKPKIKPLKIKMTTHNTILFNDLSNISTIKKSAFKQTEIIEYLKLNNQIQHHNISNFSTTALKALQNKNIIQINTRDVTISDMMEQAGLKQKEVALNDQQQSAYEIISENIKSQKYKGFLLHGVTGCGKTEIYIKLIESALELGHSAIVLVPEIALTTHLASRFYGAFHDNVAIWHSNLTSTQRSNIWHKLALDEIKIVIGARSALFMPMVKLCLIIVDEEHEHSYKQQNPSPRYHARDAALLRGFLSNSTVVLGSATPSMESHYNALHKKLEKIEITRRFAKAQNNTIHLIDLKKEFATTSPFLPFSKFLITKIEEKLNLNQQIILFHNRRGYSNFVLCKNCGWTPKCNNCDITLTYHKSIKKNLCHYCNKTEKLPHICPVCENKKFLYRGFGTQKLESIITERFPRAKIRRLDMDTTSKSGHMHKVLKDFEKGKIQIIVGTQMIAKGLDFPNVSLVGVLNADLGLYLPDFRAREKVFQLLYQVTGRAGRGNIPGEVVIQSFNPNDFTINCAVQQNIKKFINVEYSDRNAMAYPPFSRIASINFSGKNEQKVQEASVFVSGFIFRNNKSNIHVLGPISNPISKIKNLYRHYILLKSRKEKDPSGIHLRNLLSYILHDKNVQKLIASVNMTIDIDPSGLL